MYHGIEVTDIHVLVCVFLVGTNDAAITKPPK